jgi:hypothetical protein
MLTTSLEDLQQLLVGVLEHKRDDMILNVFLIDAEGRAIVLIGHGEPLRS